MEITEKIQELLSKIGLLKDKIEGLIEENKKLKQSEKSHVEKFEELLKRATDCGLENAKLKKDLENAYKVIHELEKQEVKCKSFIEVIIDFFKGVLK